MSEGNTPPLFFLHDHLVLLWGKLYLEYNLVKIIDLLAHAFEVIVFFDLGIVTGEVLTPCSQIIVQHFWLTKRRCELLRLQLVSRLLSCLYVGFLLEGLFKLKPQFLKEVDFVVVCVLVVELGDFLHACLHASAELRVVDKELGAVILTRSS